MTGLASLCAQVAWQKYLTILVGSETRSISLVIAVFLFGLAAGYYVFGKITERPWTRCRLLKVYSYVELATALYIGLFYLYFNFLKELSFNSPANLFVDILISSLALLFPTFLMGASLPALTAVLPKRSEEINAVHMQIYGWNTLGAFIGVLVTGFVLIPAFGLSLTLIISALINLVAGFIFMGNSLTGYVHREKTALKPLASRIPNNFFIFSTFIAGAVVISFEVLFIRILHLSIGAGVYNFPMILSLFVGGLALGSLSVKAPQISAGFFIRQIFITVILLGILFVLSPYWSIWISHIRVSLLSIPSNYFIFKFLTYLFLTLSLFPAVFFMGRLLPLTYTLLKKNEKNYGAFCGYIYFFNTLGTVVGTLVIGYLAFYIFNLDDLFKINLGLLIGLGLIASLYERKRVYVLISVLIGLSVLFLPAWDRTGHHIGYFRIKTPSDSHFKSLFSLVPKYKGDVILFKDGPNASVGLINYKDEKISPEIKDLFPEAKALSVSFSVNAKAIGNSLGDFSTVFLLASLGYLYAPERPQGLSSAVIGLGMGMTAGIMAQLKDSRELIVLEIAEEVIENVRRSPSFSFGLLSNPKAKIIAQDGFKYFTKTKKQFDVIVSEPSNPWVVGVENVFSKEFYEIAKDSLSEGGLIVQWVQLYSIDEKTMRIIFNTLKSVFPYAKIYKIGSGDMAILASEQPLKQKEIKRRFFDSNLKAYYKSLGFYEPKDLSLIEIFSEDLFAKIADLSSPLGTHSLIQPRLAYLADKNFFLGRPVNPINLTPDYLFESNRVTERKTKAFKKYESLSAEEIQKLCIREISFFCHILLTKHKNKRIFNNQTNSHLIRLQSYIYLRKQGLIAHQPQFLKYLKKALIEHKLKSNKQVFNYLNLLISEKKYETAQKDLEDFKNNDLLESENIYLIFKQFIHSLSQGNVPSDLKKELEMEDNNFK